MRTQNFDHVAYTAHDIAHELACMIYLHGQGQVSDDAMKAVVIAFKMISKEGEYGEIEDMAKEMSASIEVGNFVDWFHPVPDNVELNF